MNATSIESVLRRGAIAGAVGSVLIHLSAVLSILAVAIPDVGFELTFPVEVELGLTDATEVAAAAAAAPPESTEASGATDPASSASGPRTDAGVAFDAATSDGGAPDAGVDAGRRRRRDAGVDAPPPLLASEDGTGAGGPDGTGTSPVAFLPAGAQVALRVDLDRVRASEVRPEVEALLAALPDWEALLSGSGVEPVRDFSRVLVATPNFDRRRIVVAGRLVDGARPPREVAREMAAAHGERLEWGETSGVPTARWVTPDGAPRRVALIGPRHFVVASDEDLEAVLAIATARTAAAPDVAPEGAEPPEPPVDAADALLSMVEGEALSLEIEGARRFVGRSPCPIPLRGRLALAETVTDADSAPTGVRLELVAHFDDEGEAARADRCYLRYVGLGRALFPPLTPLLSRLETSTEDAALTLTSSMTFAEVRTLLSFITERFAARRAAPPPDPDPGAIPGGVMPTPPPPGSPGEPPAPRDLPVDPAPG